MSFSQMAIVTVFAPLIAAILSGFGQHKFGVRFAQVVTCACIVASAMASLTLFSAVNLGDTAPFTVQILQWIETGHITTSWALRVDQLSALMFVVVTVVSSVVHFYSIGYMSHDPSRARFMAYLSLFTFAMLMLVSADNFLQLFFGWEGVGVASYLLIGFWNDRASANAAAIKAFVVNRVGDFGLALGIFMVFTVFDTLDFQTFFERIPGQEDATFTFFGSEWSVLSMTALFLFIGAMGKSAQLGLHTWLPDAMEGPTPVSALIHAATMVTAGVFMVARLSPLYEYTPDVLQFITILGALTAFCAAYIALTQTDIKRVIAYSTMSQLGYMFFALGISAYGAALFHLFTHAFFKALLFLGAGSVIHALHDEQDMRKMGGLWRKIPITYGFMWLGSLALIGVPIFAGYYSKDMILEAAYATHSNVGHFAFWFGIAAALMTALYSVKLMILTFHGETRADPDHFVRAHEAPKIMNIPLIVLAAGAVFSGMWGYDYFVGYDYDEFWDGSLFLLTLTNILEEAHHVPKWVIYAPLIAAFIGVLVAYGVFLKSYVAPETLQKRFGLLYRLSFNKFYIDELYHALFVRPAHLIGNLFWAWGDRGCIDRFGPDGMMHISRHCARILSRWQSGYIYRYAITMLLGVIIILTLMFFKTVDLPVWCEQWLGIGGGL